MLCTVRHPNLPGSGITISDGNSEDALGRSGLLLFYGNSLVVFRTTAKPVGDEQEYQSKVLQRRDFESQERIDVQRTGSWRVGRMMPILQLRHWLAGEPRDIECRVVTLCFAPRL